MIVIVENGKSATIESIQSVIDYTKLKNIKVIFYQQEFDSKQAETIANEIGGKVISLNILSDDYINNLKTITDTFITELK